LQPTFFTFTSTLRSAHDACSGSRGDVSCLIGAQRTGPAFFIQEPLFCPSRDHHFLGFPRRRFVSKSFSVGMGFCTRLYFLSWSAPEAWDSSSIFPSYSWRRTFRYPCPRGAPYGFFPLSLRQNVHTPSSLRSRRSAPLIMADSALRTSCRVGRTFLTLSLANFHQQPSPMSVDKARISSEVSPVQIVQAMILFFLLLKSH